MTTLVEQREILALLDQDPAAGLRATATLIRQQAQTAPIPPGPWESEFTDVIRTDVPFGFPGYCITECATLPEAQYIASWHPGIACAVADWLVTAGADVWAHGPLCPCATGCEACGDNLWESHARAALTVARAYLGGDS